MKFTGRASLVHFWIVLLALSIPALIGKTETTPGRAEYQKGKEENSFIRFETNELPPLPNPTAGALIGRSNGAVIVAGGDQYGQNPFSGEGDAVQTGVWVFPSMEKIAEGVGSSEAWREYEMNTARAYGAVASNGEAVYLIGGTDGKKIKTSVLKLEWDPEKEKLIQEKIGDFPQPLMLGAASWQNGKIYVAGGAHELEPFRLNPYLWVWDTNEGGQNSWQRAKDVPRPGYARAGDPNLKVHERLAPAMVSQNDRIHVFGGYKYDNGRWRALASGWRYGPGKSRHDGYRDCARAPTVVGNATAVELGQSHILVLGARGEAHEAKEIWKLIGAGSPVIDKGLLYNEITDAWSKMGSLINVRSGAGAVSYDVGTGIYVQEGILMIGGLAAEDDAPSDRMDFVTLVSERTLAGYEWTVIAVYFGIVLLIGSYFATRDKTTNDYFVGGRRVPWWAVMLSVQATGASAISFMAIPARAYDEDLLYYGTMWVGLVMVIAIAIWLIPIYYRCGVISIYSYLEERFHISVRLLGSFMSILFQITGRFAVILLLPSLALSAVTGVHVYWCVMFAGIFSMIYTAVGGINAVIWSDVLQFIVMIGGAILAFFIMINHLDGGLGAAWNIWNTYDKTYAFDMTFDLAVPSVYLLAVVRLMDPLNPATNQPEMQRIMATGSLRDARKAWVGQWLLAVPMLLLWFGLGLMLFAFYHQFPDRLDPTMNVDTVFPQFIHMELPLGITGLLLAGLFAASMSSIDSAMNSSSTMVVKDFYQRFYPNASDASLMWLARIITLVVGILGTGAALFLASIEVRALWDVFLGVVGTLMGAFPAVFLLGMISTRANWVGALAGFICGTIAVIVIPRLVEVHVLIYPTIAQITCLAVGFTVSLLVKVKGRDLTDMTIHTTEKRKVEQ